MLDSFRNVSLSLPNGEQWTIYADGFKRAAELIIIGAKNTHDINTIIFPVLALYRQYVELTLKEIISYGQYLSSHDIRQGGHDLRNLWTSAKSYIKIYYMKIEKNDLKQIETFISKLHDIDPTSQATRYPHVKSKSSQGGREPSFSFNTEPINIDNLLEEINELSLLFKNITSIMSIAQDLEAEFRSDCY